MSKRTVPDLKELFKQASEIAQQVPESMQEAAFNRAIDLLTSGTKSEPVSGRSDTQNTSNKKSKKKAETPESNTSIDDLLAAIDSTQHPGITSASKVLDRSLMVLQIARTDHDVDGLTPGEIAKILTDKFRISTTQAAVSMALGKATTLVNRVSSGPGFQYRIMAPGEDYLAHLGDVESTPTPYVKEKSQKKSASKKSIKKKAVSRKKSTNGGAAKKKTSNRGSTDPKSAVNALIESGYFSKARTGPEVQAFLKSKRGFNFGIAQLRLAMLRLVREEKLDRDENEEGKYEYRKS